MNNSDKINMDLIVKKINMKWVLFTGTWRLTNATMEQDVRSDARRMLLHGNGIVTCGTTGANYFAATEALRFDPTGGHLKIFIPSNLTNYLRVYREKWKLSPITTKDIDKLEDCLLQLKKANPEHLIELPFDGDIEREHYNFCHKKEMSFACEVHAFHVNNSDGTQLTLDEAERSGVPIRSHRKYAIIEP